MKEKIRIESPEGYLTRAAGFFRKDGSFRLALVSLLTVLVTAFMSYTLLIVYGHGNPDAITEGMSAYTAGDWALACGRWATRYMNAAAGNVIMPPVWVTLYMLCVFVSVMLLVKLWKLRSALAVCLISVLMAVNPTVIEQSLLQYMFMAWGISNLLGTTFVYLCCAPGGRPWVRITAAALCTAVAFGLYQAVIGYICMCFCLTLILSLSRGTDMRGALRLVLRVLIAGVCGALLYFIILRVEFARYGVEQSSRVEDFSLAAIFSSLSYSVPDAYVTFFEYFGESVLRRGTCYILLAALFAVFLTLSLITLFRRRQYANIACLLVLIALVPAFTNISKIVFPYNTTVTIMEYQNMLVVPFLFAFAEGCELKLSALYNPARICTCLLCAALGWGYIVSANATYKCYELSYRHIGYEVSAILDDVYDMPGYTRGETVAFAGFPDDSYLRENVGIYKYAYGQYDNPVFWDGMMGLQVCRRNYLTEYFGIDGGYIYGGQYNDAVHSAEFAAMPVWPADGSVQRINGMIVVKLFDDPPIFD